MKRTIVVAAAAALILAGCASTGTPVAVQTSTEVPAATTAPTTTTKPRPVTTTPAAPVIDWTMQRDGYAIDIRIVRNYTADQLPSVFKTMQSRTRDEGGYFVQVRCDSTDAVLGNGKFAVGRLGAAQTGLAVGGSEWEPMPGAVCEL